MNRRNTKSQTPLEQENLACPRCGSTNAKFHSYSNKKLSQPCHFCKSCHRYWTQGGTLRDIYVSRGTGKSAKQSRPNTASTSVSSSAVSGHGQSIPIPSTPVFNQGGSVFCGDGEGKTGRSTSLLDSQGPGFHASGGIGVGSRGVSPFSAVADGMDNTRQFVRTNAELYVPVCLNKKVSPSIMGAAGVNDSVMANVLENAGVVNDSVMANVLENAGVVNDSVMANVLENAGVVNDSVMANVLENAGVVNDCVMVDDGVPQKFPTPIITHCDDPTSQAPSTRVAGNDQDKRTIGKTFEKKNRVENGMEGDYSKAGPSFQSPRENGGDINATLQNTEKNTQSETARGNGEYTDLYDFKLEARIVQLERIFGKLKTKFCGNGK